MSSSRVSYSAIPVPDLLSIRANVSSIPSFPLVHKLFREKPETRGISQPKITIDYRVEKFDNRFKSPGGKFFWRLNNNTIYYELPIGVFGRIRLKLIWDDANPTLILSPAFHRMARINVGTVHAVGKYLRDVANVVLLRNGYALLHAAGFVHREKTILLIGLSNTGKTTSIIDVVRNHGALYYGDDLVVTDGIKVYACPATRTNVNASHAPSKRYRVYQSLRRSIPFVENLFRAPSLSISDFLGSEKIASARTITDIFILKRDDSPSVQQIGADTGARLLFASNQAEFTHNTNQVLWAAEYLSAGISMGEAMKSESSILERLARNAKIHSLKGDAAHFREELISYLHKS